MGNITRPCLRKPNQIKAKQNKRLHCMSSVMSGVTVTHSVLFIGHPCPLWQFVLSVPVLVSLQWKFIVLHENGRKGKSSKCSSGGAVDFSIALTLLSASVTIGFSRASTLRLYGWSSNVYGYIQQSFESILVLNELRSLSYLFPQDGAWESNPWWG